uniref:Zinc finger protein 598 (inferred by orthology to a human protein) n=1 Tax=Strongyloides venezuelensis TaxID=75913 RepID=A0A0K0FLR2_STRVS
MENNRTEPSSKPKRRNPNNNRSHNIRRNEHYIKDDQSFVNEKNETLELANIIRESGVSTKHIVDGLPIAVTFVSTCEICYEEREFFGMFPCNHCVCMQCLLKQTLFTESIACCHCRNIYDSIVFFRVDHELPTEYPPIDIQRCKKRYISRYNTRLQRKYNIIFGCSLTVQAYDHVLGHRCYICDKNDDDSDHKTFAKLREHYLNKHRRKFCEVCCDHEKKFSSERIPFSFSEFKEHLQGKKTAWEELATDGHVNCRFCRNKIFYGSEERFRHYRLEHQTCEICLRERNEFMVFENFRCLLYHYENKHYLCPDGDCRKSGLCFSSDAELQLHISEQHKKANRVQPIPLSFPSSLRNSRPSGSTSQNTLVQEEQKQPTKNVIPNAVVKTSSGTQGIGMYNYVSNRANLGISDSNAFPSLLSNVEIKKPPTTQNTTPASVIVSKAKAPEPSKTKNTYEATGSDFPSLLSNATKKIDANVWGDGNVTKLKSALAKPVVNVTANSKTKKDVPKPRGFDPNTWATPSSAQGKNDPTKSIPRISGFADFQEVVNSSKASPLNNMSSLSNSLVKDTTCLDKKSDEDSELFVRADGFKIPVNHVNNKRPPLMESSSTVKKVPPLEAFPVLFNPYQSKENETKEKKTNTQESTGNNKLDEPKDFNSVVSEMFKNLNKN